MKYLEHEDVEYRYERERKKEYLLRRLFGIPVDYSHYPQS